MAGRHGIKMRSAALTAAMAACSRSRWCVDEDQVGAGLPGRLENERQPRGLGGDDGRRFGLSTVGPFTGGRLRHHRGREGLPESAAARHRPRASLAPGRAGGAAPPGALGPRADAGAGGRRDAGRAHASLAASSRRDRQGLCRLPLLPGSRRAAGGGESMGKVWALAWPRRALVDGPRLGERPPRRPSPPTSWPPTRTNRRSRGGRPASSTRAGAPCSKARRWPTCPRATSCAARRSSSPTDGATPGPRPSRPSSAEATPRSWSPIPAGRAGETARAGGVRRPVTAIRPQRAGGCHPEGRSASGGRRSR